MKFIIVACIAAISAAQDGQKIDYPIVRQIGLPEGRSDRAITTAKSIATVKLFDAQTGGLSILQEIVHNPAYQSASGHCLLSWLMIAGAADDGSDWYSMATARYSSGPRAVLTKKNMCGTTSKWDSPGYLTMQNDLSTSGCSLGGVTTFLQTNFGDFTHSAVAPLSDPKTALTLKVGSNAFITTGFSSYKSPDGDAPALDLFKSPAVKVTLDGAVTMTVTATIASVLALTSF